MKTNGERSRLWLLGGSVNDALEADARRLVLIHYSCMRGDPQAVLEEARAIFRGPVELAEDLNVYEF